MSQQRLDELEQVVLLTILRLDGDVHGVRIVDEMERLAARKTSRAAVYITIRRLEKKGLLSSRLGAPTPGRGGRPRRCVKVEPTGMCALMETRGVDPTRVGLDTALVERL